ncbi:MAG: zinc ribbon domain-containing protein [Polyangiaceae bacterium]
MPTYEYACTSCGNTWEDIQKISEPALTTCPKCKNETAKRQISGGSFILKGGGWYADAYSSTPKSSKKSDSSDSSKSSSSESKGESKSETKSESKSETKSESTAPAASPAAAPAAKKD